MKLKKIKLSGFKSFVDVATFPVEKNLVGIVGPNGCGKSNVIDAVRWVMGESSAKQLRGDSMTDVIFNGTSTRKPVSQASIELVFDNSIKQLAGQYANYSEIAIKRVISREGASNYYLNNTRCRRKDLLDLFMGTGLGPRSYTIIEQGMISRIIEARPEDLRVYLEEAAGISKYKERRRETENRIKHTRENLDRVNDIINELSKQLEKLAAQSETAQKYKVLKDDLTTYEQSHIAIQYQQFNQDYQQYTEKVNQKNVEIEQFNSQIESFNLEQEKKRIDVNKLQHQQQEEQAKYYQIEQQINNLEQEIKRLESDKANTKNNYFNVEKQLGYCSSNLESKKTNFETVSNELIDIEPEYLGLSEFLDENKANLQQAEQELAAWDKNWSLQQEEYNNNSKAISQSQALIEKHDTLIVRSQKRLEILKQEQEQIKQQQDSFKVDRLRAQQEELAEIELQKQQQLEFAVESYEQNEEKISQLQDDLNNANKELQAKQGRLASLKTLQEHALGKDQKLLNKWLQDNNLVNVKRLGEIVSIDNGWEQALEAVLRDYIKAIVLPDNKDLADYDLLDKNLVKQQAAFIKQSHDTSDFDGVSNNINSKFAKDDLLINKINAPKEIAVLLNDIYCVDSVQEAKEQAKHLKFNESLITKDGVWLNSHWFTASVKGGDSASDNKEGILSREQEIKELQLEIEQLEQVISETSEQLHNNKASLDELKATRDQLQKEIRDVLKNASEIKSDISREESRLEEQSHRLHKIEQDIADSITHVEADGGAVRVERSKLEQAMLMMEELSNQKLMLQETGDEIRLRLKQARTGFDTVKDKLHKSELDLQKLKQQEKHLSDEIKRLEKQKERLTSEKEGLNNKVDSFDEPIITTTEQLEFRLQEKEQQRVILDSRTDEFEQANQKLVFFEKELTALRHAHEQCRDQNEKFKIKQQEVNTKLNAVNEQIAELGLEVEKILPAISEDLSETKIKNLIRELRRNIEDLGPVNLTAIEEYKTESERKNYLDSQQNDLLEAIEALEEAIAQIDEETKSRFKETFDFVNEQFQYLFPKIFGGGRAVLTLSGEDLLDTGVTVMAQPPGKRNSTIHLLSGGEKALTAIALVFAIFRLNPAPFCMLDEVDAPLDDANVNRFCNIVKEMAKEIQFIFITHNKVTMTMAEHLIGVTQHEPGVSRLVAVDVEEASKLVEA